MNTAGAYSTNSEGNLLVNTPSAVLKNMTVKGDLYLTQGIGSGEVTLDNVIVKGRTIVRGGENSIIVKNSHLEGIFPTRKPITVNSSALFLTLDTCSAVL